MAATGITASKPEVRMADKIAMRSLVLSKNMPRIGGNLNLVKSFQQRPQLVQYNDISLSLPLFLFPCALTPLTG